MKEVKKEIQVMSMNCGFISKEMEKISVEEIKTVINSCSRTCQAVIDNKGLHTKY